VNTDYQTQRILLSKTMYLRYICGSEELSIKIDLQQWLLEANRPAKYERLLIENDVFPATAVATRDIVQVCYTTTVRL
jgi:hypothetical protein